MYCEYIQMKHMIYIDVDLQVHWLNLNYYELVGTLYVFT